jgi:lipopolysaccharide transport system ATP-binding protein
MSSDVVISARGLSKTYRLFGHPGDRVKQFLSLGLRQYHREFKALRDLTFEIRKGETIGIVGRNGSGKSTLLQLVCGILKPTTGSMEVRGRLSALLELGAGFNPEFTGRENVYFQGAIMGFSRATIDDRFESVAAFADIGEFIDQPVRVYSSGMYVRLAFAIAIHADPDILVVDEALAVGDMAFQAKCMSAFRRLQSRGATVLFVSHDVAAVKALCDRAIRLHAGELIEFGPAAEIAESHIREMRKEMHPNPGAQAQAADVACESISDTGSEFASRVAEYRQGSGEARFVEVELLDASGRTVSEAAFEDTVTLRLHVAFNQACQVAVSYYFRDHKHQLIAGSTTQLEGYGLVAGEAGKKKIVEFTTCLPFQGGVYNVMAILSVPAIPNQTAHFVDLVENALVFRIAQRSPLRLWSMVYLQNTLRVHDA